MNDQPPTKQRINSIDLVRGVIMVIMALDHVRDMIHVDAFQRDPLDPATTTPLLYFTRWITHFCAPNFVFLAGMSAYLVGLRRPPPQLRGYLIKRGFWLVLVEVIIMAFGFTFDPFYHLIILQVIWVTGISLIILGLLVGLPYEVIFLVGIVLVCGHNLLDYAEAARQQKLNFWWHLLHNSRQRMFPYAEGHSIMVLYPLLPWIGVLVMGYCAGKLFDPARRSQSRRKILVWLGSSLVLLFLVLRILNGYGDPNPWSSGQSLLSSFYSFMNVTKYPPSLMYLCATLGPGLIFLGLAETMKGRVAAFFTVFGRVPFFYYVLHFYLIHLITLIAFFLSGCGWQDIHDPQSPFLFRPHQFGFSLAFVYLEWIAVVFILYPLCRWFGRYKRTHTQWWLSYL